MSKGAAWASGPGLRRRIQRNPGTGFRKRNRNPLILWGLTTATYPRSWPAATGVALAHQLCDAAPGNFRRSARSHAGQQSLVRGGSEKEGVTDEECQGLCHRLLHPERDRRIL